MSDPLADYHIGWQNDPEEQDPLAGYTPGCSALNCTDGSVPVRAHAAQ